MVTGFDCLVSFVVFFFKQETAYEMRISDWSSDVCSSDLLGYAVITGVFVVRFALLSDWIFNGFIQFYKARPWAVFVTVPFITACVVSITNRYLDRKSVV